MVTITSSGYHWNDDVSNDVTYIYRNIISITQTRTFFDDGLIVSFIGAALVLLTGHSGGASYEYAWLGNLIGLVVAIAWGMVSNIGTTSYYKILRNESRIMININWNCSSCCILFIQCKYIIVASRRAKLGVSSIFDRLCDNNLRTCNVVCRY